MRSSLADSALRTPGRLVIRTVAIPDPGSLLDRLPDDQPVAWIRDGEGLAGHGAAAAVTLPAGDDRFTAGEKWLREVFDSADVSDEVQQPGTGPVAFGSFTFDAAAEGSVVIVPRAVIGRRAGIAWLTTAEPDAVHGDAGLPAADPFRATNGIRWSDGGLSAPQWERAVATALAAIRAGSLRKVVLARDLKALADQDIDVRLVLSRLATSYPSCYTFACAGLAGATPELLVSRSASTVRSLVLAGTAPRGGTPDSDDALAAALLAGAKDLAEHQYAVADVRAALAPLCADLHIDAAPHLLRLPNVQHLASSVHGRLDGDGSGQTSLSLAAALHPTAAVCGTPAEAAMEAIRQLESMDRGRYGGPVGWMDADGNGEWGIALRCGLLDGRRARLFAGCGIVAGSGPSAELAEAQAKFRPMQQALEG